LARPFINQAPPSPGELREDIPQALEDIILKCLEKDAGDRFQTCAELEAALASKDVVGGTAPGRVAAEIGRLKGLIEEFGRETAEVKGGE